MGGITTAEQVVAVLLGLRSRYRSRGKVAAADVMQRAIVVVRAQMRPTAQAPAVVAEQRPPSEETEGRFP
jgi:hypothetical protein